MVKSLSTFLIFLVSIFVVADLPPITKEAFERNTNRLSIEDNAQIITISANRFGITKSNLVVGKPSLNELQMGNIEASNLMAKLTDLEADFDKSQIEKARAL